jgi:hypothetical protein
MAKGRIIRRVYAPATTRRVAKHTSQEINERIAKQTECTVAKYASPPSEIDARLAELDHEWDIERLLEANASTLVRRTLLAASVNRKWIYLPLVVQFLQRGSGVVSARAGVKTDGV